MHPITRSVGLAYWMNVLLFAAALFVAWRAHRPEVIWQNYADPKDYLHQSTIPITTGAFWAPKKSQGFYPRPFTVPLFYKIVGSDPDRIIAMQKLIHTVSAFLFALCVLPSLHHALAKHVFLIGWYLLMLWWNILGWASMPLSESLSASLMFLWLGSFLQATRKRTIVWIVLHCLVTILFCFTRDNWPYMLLVFYASYLLVAVLHERTLVTLLVGMLLFSLATLVLQQYTGNIGQRYRLPVINNIVFRVLPRPEYLRWFEQHGMPQARELKEKYSITDGQAWKVYPLYDDPEFTTFSAWVLQNGTRVYSEFLLTHLCALFLADQERSELRRIFAFNTYYVGRPENSSWISDAIFPVPLMVIVGMVGALLYVSRRMKTNVWIFPLVLTVAFAVNAWLLYLADALEVDRHEYLTVTSFQFVGLVSLTYILDSLLKNQTQSTV